ncbi:hypothetical protein EDB87DRAFT_915499 [Lactarius vividus]|nr:hypothetical protein EDB87DRAFT_915499 [Lactarius vividus]
MGQTPAACKGSGTRYGMAHVRSHRSTPSFTRKQDTQRRTSWDTGAPPFPWFSHRGDMQRRGCTGMRTSAPCPPFSRKDSVRTRSCAPTCICATGARRPSGACPGFPFTATSITTSEVVALYHVSCHVALPYHMPGELETTVPVFTHGIGLPFRTRIPTTSLNITIDSLTFSLQLLFTLSIYPLI